MVNVTTVNLLQLATSFQYVNELQTIANDSINEISFISYDSSFVDQVLGPNISQQLVAEESWEAFHEAGVFNIATGTLYASSNRNSVNAINVTAIDISNNNQISTLHYANVRKANGGAAFYPPGASANSSADQQIVWCDQGDETHPSQLTVVNPATGSSQVILDNFLGRNFTSLNDVEQDPLTGDLWFTDARYGYWQGFRPTPSLRPQVYRFEPGTGVIQAVADDFVAPNGIELRCVTRPYATKYHSDDDISPDYKHVYVTDTGAQTYPSSLNLTSPANIYRFDITSDGKRLYNRQVFAYSDNGFPDGIHTDTAGNVYSGCGDGIHVWNPSGVLLGKIAVANGGVNNFAFVPGGMYIFNGKKLFKITIQAEGRTVKRDFGLS